MTDYVPEDMDYPATAALNIANGWDATPVTSTTNLAAGANTSVQIALVISSRFQGTSIINNAEIIYGDNVLGLLDEDSTPGSEDGSMADTNDNDTGMTDGSDDYDPATIMICQSNCGTFPWDGTN